VHGSDCEKKMRGKQAARRADLLLEGGDLLPEPPELLFPLPLTAPGGGERGGGEGHGPTPAPL